MKQFIIYFTLLLFSSIGFKAKSQGLYEHFQIKSDTLSEKREIKVFLPQNYPDSDISYPVLYQLEGDKYFFQSIAAVDHLRKQGLIPPIIIVTINSLEPKKDFCPSGIIENANGSNYLNSGADRFLAFIENELIPEIDRKYRTNQFRILSGHSYGGLFSTYAMVTHPNVFKAYIASAPLVKYNDRLVLKRALPYFREGKNLPVYLYLSYEEENRGFRDYKEYKGAIDSLEGIIIAYTERKPKLLKELIPEYQPYFFQYKAQINGLKELFSGFPLSDDLIAAGGRAIIEHYEEFERIYGYKVISENLINEIAEILIRKFRYDEAIRIVFENTRRNPDSWKVWDQLARAYEAKGDITSARKYYKKSIILYPGNINADEYLKKTENKVQEKGRK